MTVRYNKSFFRFFATMSLMEHVIVGLGNPGKEYADTRHNTGRMAVELLRETFALDDWEERKELRARMSRGVYVGMPVTLLEPETYMNNSGKSVAAYLKRSDEMPGIIVVHDDIDLPLGSLRLSYDRGSGGHNGVRSVEEEIKTREFMRVRIGIAPLTFLGTIRKPKGEAAVERYVLGKFSFSERRKITPALEKSVAAIETIMKEGREAAMNMWNQKDR